MTNYEIIKFIKNDIDIDVKVDYENTNIWLNQKDMAILFKINQSAISKHTKNIIEN